MKKYLLLSFLLHASLLSLTLFKFNKEINNSQNQHHGNGQYKNGYKETQQIVELIEGTGDKPKPKNFYWGIGISSSEYFSDIDHVKYLINEVMTVAKGYCAEEAGIKDGDLIYLINNERISDINDIIGTGPEKIQLTINRKGVILTFNFNRCKVYY